MSAESEINRPELLVGVTSRLSLVFHTGQRQFFEANGFEIVGCCSGAGADDSHPAVVDGMTVLPVPMAREISIASDLRSVWTLWRLLRRRKPQVVNVGTPKMGLVGGLAAALARVPVRVYTMHGLRLETTTGWKRRLLTLAEKLACRCAHRVICVSTSLRRRAVELGLVTPENAVVLANGTCNGIAYNCFAPNAATHEESKKLRAQLGIPPDAPVLGFVGRFTNDKGVRELLAAFHLLRAVVPGLQLLMVGDFEQGDAVPITLRRQIEDDSSIVRPGFVNDTAPYYPLMDVLALPTYREGFGCVALEAACAGVPTVTTTATGAVDAVVDGVTGFNVPVGDVEALTTALARLLNDAELCKRMGAAAQERVRKDFRQEVIWEALLKLYRDLMRERGITERRAQEYSPARLA